MTEKVKIIALSGTNGSGKDTTGNIIAEDHNYLFVSVTDLLREEAINRSLTPTRMVLRTISAQWRRTGGLGVLVDKALDLYNSDDKDYSGLVIASLRNPGEVDRVHELGGVVTWIDADPKIRYERVRSNIHHRGRSHEDDVSFEEFVSHEQAEMNRQEGSDEATLDMQAVKDKSDVFFNTDASDIIIFRDEIKRRLFS
jgi:cytidylate kinase